MSLILAPNDDDPLELDIPGEGDVDEQLLVRIAVDTIYLVQPGLPGLEDQPAGVVHLARGGSWQGAGKFGEGLAKSIGSKKVETSGMNNV